MFETMTHLALQQYWWFIVSLLAAILVFLMFVQGGQTLIFTLGKNDLEKKMIINTLGRKWEFTFTTLVTFGGAFFASFPLFYATSFGGAYWVWMAILIAFVLQAVAYEFRSKPDNLFGPRVYEIFLFINGALGTILIGTAVGTFFTGSMFSVDPITNFSRWELSSHGLEAALNIQNVSLGLAVFFLARVLGMLYIMNSIESKTIFERAKRHLLYNTLPFLVFFLFFVIRLMFLDGFAYDPESGSVFMEANKYLQNFLAMPAVLILFLAGVLLVLYGIVFSWIRTWTKGIWFAGFGTVFTVLALFLIAGYNNTSFYPSVFDLQSSLTIENASSSKYTLTVMSYVTLFIPVVIAYIVWAWRAINRSKIDEAEMEGSTHTY